MAAGAIPGGHFSSRPYLRLRLILPTLKWAGLLTCFQRSFDCISLCFKFLFFTREDIALTTKLIFSAWTMGEREPAPHDILSYDRRGCDPQP